MSTIIPVYAGNELHKWDILLEDKSNLNSSLYMYAGRSTHWLSTARTKFWRYRCSVRSRKKLVIHICIYSFVYCKHVKVLINALMKWDIFWYKLTWEILNLVKIILIIKKSCLSLKIGRKELTPYSFKKNIMSHKLQFENCRDHKTIPHTSTLSPFRIPSIKTQWKKQGKTHFQIEPRT